MRNRAWPGAGVRLVLAVAALQVGSRLPAHAAPLRLVTELLPPFSYEEGGVVKGVATDVVRAAMAEAGVPYSLELLPWRRALDTALHEKDVLIYSVARTPSREGQLVWVVRICDRQLALYCLKERRDLLGHPLSELPGATFAVVQGDASVELLHSLGVDDRNLHFVRDAAAPLASRHVLAGRSDFFICNPYRFPYLVKDTGLAARFQRHSLLAEAGGYFLAANPGTDPEAIARIRSAFAALSARGTLQRILKAALPPLAAP